MKRIIPEILIAALILYVIAFFIFALTGKMIIEPVRIGADNGIREVGHKYILPENITPGELSLCDYYDYKDIKSKVESVSPSRRYAILSLYWKDESWPYEYYLQDIRNNKSYKFPNDAIELVGIDIPSIISWAPSEKLVLIAFNCGEASEYVRAYKITANGIIPKDAMPPFKGLLGPYQEIAQEFTLWRITKIYWLNDITAVIQIEGQFQIVDYGKHVRGEAPLEKTMKGIFRFVYSPGKGFRKY